MKENQSTKQVAIIGESISHSMSPAMMNAAFREKGLDYHFPSSTQPRKISETC